MSQFWSPDEVRRSPDDHQNKKRILTNLEVIMYTEMLYGPTVGHGLSKVSIFLIFNIFCHPPYIWYFSEVHFLGPTRFRRGPDEVRTPQNSKCLAESMIYFYLFQKTCSWSKLNIPPTSAKHPDGLWLRLARFEDLVRTSSGLRRTSSGLRPDFAGPRPDFVRTLL